MGLYRRTGSRYWWSRITLPGREPVQESTRTTDECAAQEWHDRRRAELWRQAEFGERPAYRWEDAVLRWLSETAHKRDHPGDRQRLAAIHAALEGRLLTDVTGERLTRQLQVMPGLKTPGARNRYRATVRAILRRAEREWDWIDKAPTIRLEAETRNKGQWLTEAEAGRLIQAAPAHLQPVIQFALATGLRKANILGLRWQNVDMARQQLWVHPDDAKGGKAIGIPLNALAMQVLNACRGQHPENVFTVGGRPYRWIDHRTWLSVIEKAGLPGVRFHDLRHTWASWLAQAGVDPQHLKTLGGWSTLAMVERYSHLNVEHLRAAADRIPSTFSLQPEIIDFEEARQHCARR